MKRAVRKVADAREIYRVSQEIAKRLGLITFYENDEVFVCDDKAKLVRHGAAKLSEALEGIFEEQFTPGVYASALLHVKSSTRRSMADFVQDTRYIHCENGVIDLETFDEDGLPVLLEHSPERPSLVRYAFDYDPKARPVKFFKWFAERQPDRNTRERILQQASLVFERRPMKRQATIFFGPHDCGKSTFGDVIAKLLGEDNVSSQSLQSLTSQGYDALFAKAAMFDKALNVCAELPGFRLESTEEIKRILGGDLVDCRYMRQPLFKYRPTAWELFMCNVPPEINEEKIWADAAFFERFNFFEWKRQLAADKIDTSYLSELTTPEELSGLANHLLRHLLESRRKKNWGFDWDWQRSQSIWRNLLSESDIIQKFIDSQCAPASPKQGIPTVEFYSRLAGWCNQNHFKVPSFAEARQAMDKKSAPGRTHHQRSWMGLQWRDSVVTAVTIASFGSQDTRDTTFPAVNDQYTTNSVRTIQTNSQKGGISGIAEGSLRSFFGRVERESRKSNGDIVN